MRALGDIARLNARRYPGKTALVMGDRRLTYAELNARADALAGGLAAVGVAAGDRVALLALNSLEYPVVVTAVAKLGAVLVPVNFRLRKDEIAYVLNDARPRALLADPELAPAVDAAWDDLAEPPQLVALAGEPPRAGLTLAGLLDRAAARTPAVAVDPASPAMLMYTSGTTGFPKGVLYSHAAYLGVYHGMVIEGDLTHDDVALVSLPLFHNGGLNAVLMPTLMLGGTAVIMGKGFDPEETLAAVEAHRVTLAMWVPTMLAMLVAHHRPSGRRPTSLRKVWYGSAPIAAPVLEAATERFGVAFYQWYGQTETGMNAVLRPEDHAARSQCTGREMFNAELRIVDEAGRDVPPGGIGEIVSAQRALGMLGYFGNDEATRRTVRDGWIHTGDLARVEGEGYFTVVDRKNDMIISGGENIYPKEIEDVLVRHPAVAEVAVFGIPDDLYGEVVCAAVVARPGHAVAAEALVQFCAANLAGYKKPRRVELLAELPKNATGKVTKHILRAPFWHDRARKV